MKVSLIAINGSDCLEKDPLQLKEHCHCSYKFIDLFGSSDNAKYYQETVIKGPTTIIIPVLFLCFFCTPKPSLLESSSVINRKKTKVTGA